MKSEVLPPIRVTSALRREAEDVLAPDESMSSFVTEAVTMAVTRRKLRQAFIDRGLASRDNARQRQMYRPAEEVLAELEAIADKCEGKA